MVETGCNPTTAAYLLRRQTLTPSAKPGLPICQDHLFAAMTRRFKMPMGLFKLAANQVVEPQSQRKV